MKPTSGNSQYVKTNGRKVENLKISNHPAWSPQVTKPSRPEVSKYMLWSRRLRSISLCRSFSLTNWLISYHVQLTHSSLYSIDSFLIMFNWLISHYFQLIHFSLCSIDSFLIMFDWLISYYVQLTHFSLCSIDSFLIMFNWLISHYFQLTHFLLFSIDSFLIMFNSINSFLIMCFFFFFFFFLVLF